MDNLGKARGQLLPGQKGGLRPPIRAMPERQLSHPLLFLPDRENEKKFNPLYLTKVI